MGETHVYGDTSVRACPARLHDSIIRLYLRPAQREAPRAPTTSPTIKPCRIAYYFDAISEFPEPQKVTLTYFMDVIPPLAALPIPSRKP